VVPGSPVRPSLVAAPRVRVRRRPFCSVMNESLLRLRVVRSSAAVRASSARLRSGRRASTPTRSCSSASSASSSASASRWCVLGRDPFVVLGRRRLGASPAPRRTSRAEDDDAARATAPPARPGERANAGGRRAARADDSPVCLDQISLAHDGAMMSRSVRSRVRVR
jgi:hypothetical protein